eukprot:TRINITY_DN14405_c0_g1_i9.p1 TRINITY_DN14405_c0_g1~~TRINITY_DN14405_c0_g1_i9.p1  ORF type:complete len:375 (-),score=39.91 TRINITY_DN14405_c0_g1_i9:94-1155(-)
MWQSLFQISSAVSSTPAVQLNVDCLLGREASLQERLTFVFVTSFALLLGAVLFAIARCRKDMRHLGIICLKIVLVWQNQFYAEFTASFAAALPCISLRPDTPVLAYSVGESCAWLPGMQHPTFIVSVLGIVGCIVTGLVFWWALFARLLQRSASRLDTLGFLAAGYRQEYEWWECTVLARKMAIALWATTSPASYAPGRFTLCMLAVIVVSLVLQLKYKPFESSPVHSRQGSASSQAEGAWQDFNNIETNLLLVCVGSLLLTGRVLTVWYEEPMIYRAAALVLQSALMMGACGFLVNGLCRAYFEQVQRKVYRCFEWACASDRFCMCQRIFRRADNRNDAYWDRETEMTSQQG